MNLVQLVAMTIKRFRSLLFSVWLRCFTFFDGGVDNGGDDVNCRWRDCLEFEDDLLCCLLADCLLFAHGNFSAISEVNSISYLPFASFRTIGLKSLVKLV